MEDQKDIEDIGKDTVLLIEIYQHRDKWEIELHLILDILFHKK